MIARVPTFESLLNSAFDQIRQNAGGNVMMLNVLLKALEDIAYVTKLSDRSKVLKHQGKLIMAIAERTIKEPEDLEVLKSSFARLG